MTKIEKLYKHYNADGFELRTVLYYIEKKCDNYDVRNSIIITDISQIIPNVLFAISVPTLFDNAVVFKLGVNNDNILYLSDTSFDFVSYNNINFIKNLVSCGISYPKAIEILDL